MKSQRYMRSFSLAVVLERMVVVGEWEWDCCLLRKNRLREGRMAGRRRTKKKPTEAKQRLAMEPAWASWSPSSAAAAPRGFFSAATLTGRGESLA